MGISYLPLPESQAPTPTPPSPPPPLTIPAYLPQEDDALTSSSTNTTPLTHARIQPIYSPLPTPTAAHNSSPLRRAFRAIATTATGDLDRSIVEWNQSADLSVSSLEREGKEGNEDEGRELFLSSASSSSRSSPGVEADGGRGGQVRRGWGREGRVRSREEETVGHRGEGAGEEEGGEEGVVGAEGLCREDSSSAGSALRRVSSQLVHEAVDWALHIRCCMSPLSALHAQQGIENEVPYAQRSGTILPRAQGSGTDLPRLQEPGTDLIGATTPTRPAPSAPSCPSSPNLPPRLIPVAQRQTEGRYRSLLSASFSVCASCYEAVPPVSLALLLLPLPMLLATDLPRPLPSVFLTLFLLIKVAGLASSASALESKLCSSSLCTNLFSCTIMP